MNENETTDSSTISTGAALAYLAGIQIVGAIVGLGAGALVGKIANKFVLPKLMHDTSVEA